MNIREVDNKFKKIMKATHTSQIDNTLKECDSEEKDRLIKLILGRINGGVINDIGN